MLTNKKLKIILVGLFILIGINTLIFFIFNTQLSKKEIYNSGNIVVPVLMHHIYDDTLAETLNYAINTSTFAQELSFLSSLGYESITDIEFYNWTQGQGFVMPEHPIMFVWDDAHKSLLDAAAVMNTYGFKGVLAVPISFVGGANYLNWSNISYLVSNYGWSLASHSVNHCNMVTSCNLSTNWTTDFYESKKYILGNTSYNPITFVYPSNSYNSTLATICSTNYSMCFGSAKGLEANIAKYNFIYTNLTDGSLRRLDIKNDTTLEYLNYGLNYTLPNYHLKLNLNENTGTTAYDSSGNGNNGTISGATWTNYSYKR